MTVGLNCTAETGTLTIDGVPMNCPAWCAFDLTALWGQYDVRGRDRLLPGVAGVVPNPRRITVTEHALPLLICGDVDASGDPYEDPWVGLETNLQYLTDNVVDPPGTGDGTRAAVLTMPSGATREADIHVLQVRLGTPLGGRSLLTGNPTAAFNAVLLISIPAGRFV